MKLKDRLKGKWLLVAAIIYLILPIDFIPDSIPLIGNLDDATLLIIQLIQSLKAESSEK